MNLNVRHLPLIALAAALGAMAALTQQNPPKPAKVSGAHKAMMDGKMADQCIAMHDQMAADMKVMDAELD